jgi:hypothetical protein
MKELVRLFEGLDSDHIPLVFDVKLDASMSHGRLGMGGAEKIDTIGATAGFPQWMS